MSKRIKAVALLGGAAMLAGGSALGYGDGVEDYGRARVIDSQPIYETVEIPEGREVCRTEPVTYYEPGRGRRNAETNEALGLIVGGLIGNQFGSGRGRTAATVGGAIVGSAIARDANRDAAYRGGRRVTREEEVCEYREEFRRESRITGYDVTYDYNGTIGRTVTDRPPGRTIRVRVAVEPLGD